MGFKNFFSDIVYGKEKDNPQGGYDEPYETDDGYEEPYDPEPAPVETAPRGGNNVSVSSGTSIEMVVVKPEKLETVTQIADYLVDRKTILLNLEETNKETARRLIDFLNGVAYAINGDLRKVATNTYVVTPSNVELSGEKLRETQENFAN